MDEQSIKNKVLQEIMDMMDSKMVDGLKSKSPKFMKVETNDPSMADDLKSKLLGDEEGSEQEEHSESPMEVLKEKMHPEMEESEPEHDDSGDLERLLEMYRGLK